MGPSLQASGCPRVCSCLWPPPLDEAAGGALAAEGGGGSARPSSRLRSGHLRGHECGQQVIKSLPGIERDASGRPSHPGETTPVFRKPTELRPPLPDEGYREQKTGPALDQGWVLVQGTATETISLMDVLPSGTTAAATALPQIELHKPLELLSPLISVSDQCLLSLLSSFWLSQQQEPVGGG